MQLFVQVDAPIAISNVVNGVLVKMHRVMDTTIDITSLQANASLAVELATRSRLQADLESLKLEWDAMLYGANSSQRANPHYQLATTGISFLGSGAAQMLYESGTACYLPAATASRCYAPSHPYYGLVKRGLAALMQRFFAEADLLVRDVPSAWVLSSSRVDYILREGQGNMHAALFQLADRHFQHILSIHERVEMLHVVLVVLSWLLAGVFLLFMMRPFLAKTQRETERIAEMLSLLPHDSDVEGMVQKALAVARLGGKGQPRRPLQLYVMVQRAMICTFTVQCMRCCVVAACASSDDVAVATPQGVFSAAPLDQRPLVPLQLVTPCCLWLHAACSTAGAHGQARTQAPAHSSLWAWLRRMPMREPPGQASPMRQARNKVIPV